MAATKLTVSRHRSFAELKCHTKKALTALSLLALLFSLPLSAAQIYQPRVAYPTTYFLLLQYDTFINFAETTMIDFAYQKEGYWYINGFGFRVENANMTITAFFAVYPTSTRLNFTLTAPSGNSTTKIYLPLLGLPTGVTGTSAWNYNSTLRTLTITATHTSPVDISVIWLSTPTEPTPTPTPPSPPSLPPPIGEEPHYTITLIITQNTNPVANALVTLGSISVLTNQQGTAIFLAGAGTYPITVTVNGETKYTSTLTVIHDATFHIDLSQPQQPPTETPPEAPAPTLIDILATNWLPITITIGIAVPLSIILMLHRKHRKHTL